MKQLGDHGADALEMARAELALQHARQGGHLDARGALGAMRIDLVHLRHEHQVAAGGGQHALVLARRARVVREILVRAELHGVHENAGHEALAVAARGLDEAQMPGMQVPHGGHEGHPPALGSPAAHALAHGGNRGDGLHAKSSVRALGIRPASRRARTVAAPRDCCPSRP